VVREKGIRSNAKALYNITDENKKGNTYIGELSAESPGGGEWANGAAGKPTAGPAWMESSGRRVVITTI